VGTHCLPACTGERVGVSSTTSPPSSPSLSLTTHTHNSPTRYPSLRVLHYRRIASLQVPSILTNDSPQFKAISERSGCLLRQLVGKHECTSHAVRVTKCRVPNPVVVFGRLDPSSISPIPSTAPPNRTMSTTLNRTMCTTPLNRTMSTTPPNRTMSTTPAVQLPNLSVVQ
jgi:hypothetical protein